MRIIEKIVFSNSAPDTTNTLWIDGKDIKIFGSDGWSTLDITENQRLYSLIQEETVDREEADRQLLDKINEELSNREEEDEALREALATETKERQNADTNLTSLINKETEDRIAADEVLNNTIEENLYYQSELDDTLAILEDHGGLEVGVTVADLKQKTFSQLFDEILFPTIYPTFVNPTATLTIKDTGLTPTIQEVGTTGSAVPTANSFNHSFNPGAINILDKKQNNRSGSERTDESYIYINGNNSNTNFPTIIPDGTITYSYRAFYNEGPQPKDSKGNDYQTPYPAGYVDSNIITVYGVYPYFANADNNDVVQKLPLTTASSITSLDFAAEGNLKHQFKLPKKYTVTKIEMLNTLSGRFEEIDKNIFAQTTESITVQGSSVAYTVYTRNDSGLNGASTFSIYFTKS